MAEAEVLFAETQASDAGALVDFLAQVMTESGFITQTSRLLTQAEMVEFLTRQLASSRDICLLAKLGQKVIATLNLVSYEKSGGYWGDLFLAVGQSYQGAGLGQTLMALAIDWAEQVGSLAGLSLSVQVRNQRAVHIYEKFGFNKDEIRDEILKILRENELGVSEILALKSMKDFKKFMLDKNTSVAYVSGFVKGAASDEVLERHNAFSLNFASSLNESLTQAKELALKLKIAALVVAFLLLWFYFSALISALVMGIIVFGVLLTLFIFAIFGINLSIFGVFGLILASAVGIDYMIFALNGSLSEKERVFGIFAAFITSFISFFILSFSQTAALSVFGLSVSLCVLIYGLCASVLSCKNIKI